MNLPFRRRLVTQKEYHEMLNEIGSLQEQVNRQEMHRIGIPFIELDGFEEVNIIGPPDKIEQIQNTFSGKAMFSREIVKLMLDLHDKKWSLESDKFLRVLNIDPSKYWKKYMVKKK